MISPPFVPPIVSTPHLCPKCHGECVIPVPEITGGTRTCPVCKGEGVIWDRYQAPSNTWVPNWPPLGPVWCASGQSFTLTLTGTSESKDEH